MFRRISDRITQNIVSQKFHNAIETPIGKALFNTANVNGAGAILMSLAFKQPIMAVLFGVAIAVGTTNKIYAATHQTPHLNAVCELMVRLASKKITKPKHRLITKKIHKAAGEAAGLLTSPSASGDMYMCIAIYGVVQSACELWKLPSAEKLHLSFILATWLTGAVGDFTTARNDAKNFAQAEETAVLQPPQKSAGKLLIAIPMLHYTVCAALKNAALATDPAHPGTALSNYSYYGCCAALTAVVLWMGQRAQIAARQIIPTDEMVTTSMKTCSSIARLPHIFGNVASQNWVALASQLVFMGVFLCPDYGSSGNAPAKTGKFDQAIIP